MKVVIRRMMKLKDKKLIFCNLDEDPDLVTHAGTFHADEVFATVVLENIVDKDEIKICRANEVEKEVNAIVYDIAGGKLDHHQKGGNGVRDNEISYASFGLVWKKYGKEFLEKIGFNDIEELQRMVDRKIVQEVDSNDNGELQINNNFNLDILSISKLISLYNSKWDEDDRQNEHFSEAVGFARVVLEKILDSSCSKIKAKSLFNEEYKNIDGKYMILKQAMPWKEFLLEKEDEKSKNILYVIHPSNRGGYNIVAVPKKLNSFENRKSFPIEWAGLKGKDLQEKSGISTARFCHNNRFICVTETLEDAIRLAEIAVNK